MVNTKVLLYLWSMKPVLKLSKNSKYYEQDCLRFFLLLFTPLIMIQISEHSWNLTLLLNLENFCYPVALFLWKRFQEDCEVKKNVKILKFQKHRNNFRAKIYIDKKIWNQAKLDKTGKLSYLLFPIAWALVIYI